MQAFAKLYNYKPNNVAISLKNKRTKNIGVIIPDIVHHFFTTVFRGIEQYANKQGYNVIVCVSDDSFDREVINMEMLANGSVDGFIMSLSAGTQRKNDFNHLKEITEQGIPIVLLTVPRIKLIVIRFLLMIGKGHLKPFKSLLKTEEKKLHWSQPKTISVLVMKGNWVIAKH